MQRIKIIKAPSRFLWYYKILGCEINSKPAGGTSNKGIANGYIALRQYIQMGQRRGFIDSGFIFKKHGELLYDSEKFIKKKGYEIKWHINENSIVSFFKHKK